MPPTRTTNLPEKLRVFVFHGVEIDIDAKEAVGDCPFCGKEGHFYVKTSTGQWSCKLCDESGNIPVFLARLLHYSKQATTDKDYAELTRQRPGCPAWALKDWGVVKNFMTGDWLFPAYNAKGKLANVCKAYKDAEGWKVISSPTCKLHPFGVDLLLGNKRNPSVIRVQEGPWDGIAVYAAMGQVRRNGTRLVKLARPSRTKSLLATEAVLAVPGSGVFNADWLDYLEDKTVRLGFDNDHPKRNPKTGKTTKAGWDGMERIVRMMATEGKTPRKLFRVRWGKAGHDPDRADHYDYRDLMVDNGPVKGLTLAADMEEVVKVKSSPKERPEEPEGEQYEPLPRSAFKDLVADYEASLHFTPQLKDTLAVMLACMASTQLQGDQIWLRIIGPPGSGKSTLAEACSASREYAFPVSLQTGFHSGYSAGGGKKKKDASLIPQMADKTTIIKDGDTLLTSPSRDRILAEMRDLYDRTSRARYRNRQTKVYEGVNTTFIICGTDEMRTLNRTFLGERFLDCEILGDEDRTPYLDRALTNAFANVTGSMVKQEETEGEDHEVHGKEREVLLKRATIGFLQHLKDGFNQGTHHVPTMSVEAGNTLKALGQFLSFIRARVNRDGTDIAYRPRPELATRLIGQFTKLALCLSVVLGKKTVDREVIRIVRKVMMDTAESFNLEVVRRLAGYKTGGLSAMQLGLELRISEGSIRKLLQDMREFNIVQRISENNRSGQRGRNRHVWRLTDELMDLHKTALGNQAVKGPKRGSDKRGRGSK